MTLRSTTRLIAPSLVLLLNGCTEINPTYNPGLWPNNDAGVILDRTTPGKDLPGNQDLPDPGKDGPVKPPKDGPVKPPKDGIGPKLDKPKQPCAGLNCPLAATSPRTAATGWIR